MADYPHPLFGPARVAGPGGPLRPPLRRLAEWSLAGVAHPPLVVGEQVLASFAAGAVRAYDRATAEPRWSWSFPGPYRLLDARQGELVMDGPTLITRWGSELFRLDPASGELLDRRPVPELSLATGVVVQGAAVGTYRGEGAYWCARLELDHGILLWRRRIPGPSGPFLTAAGEVVGVGLAATVYGGLDLATGAERWRLELGQRAAWTDVLGQRLPGRVAGWGVAAGELLVLPVSGYHLLGVDAGGGEVRWELRVPLAAPGSFAHDGRRRLYCAGSDFLCVDTETGEQLVAAQHRAAYRAAAVSDLGTLALSDSHVWGVGIRRGALVALDRADGSVTWIQAVGGTFPPRNPPVVLDGRLYLLDLTEGRLHVFEEA